MAITPPQPRPITLRLGPHDFRVRPPVFRYSVPYGEGPNFVMVNETDFDADVDFQIDGLVQDGAGKAVVRFVLRARSDSGPLRVNPGIANGTYSYVVSLGLGRGESRIEATGGSRPDIDVQN